MVAGFFCAAAVLIASAGPFPVGEIPAGTNQAAAGAKQRSPKFSAEVLPTPPQQDAPWNAPESDLPTNYITAVELLFTQGLADPRGCEYREIEVGTGNVWGGDGGVVKTHGWVFPGTAEARFGICWNGLVYPLVRSGTNANIEADVACMLTNRFSWRAAVSESNTVAVESLQAVRGCLLLRLGKADLAAACWLGAMRQGWESRNGLMQEMLNAHSNAPVGNGHPSAKRQWNIENESLRRFLDTNRIPALNLTLPATDPYLTWASDWAWTLFERMICAHARGDENLALIDARHLTAARPFIEADCARRGFRRPPSWESRSGGERTAYLDFLWQLPQILADLERRSAEADRQNIITLDLTPERETKRLILRLDHVHAFQSGQPGGVDLAGDKIVAALVAQGDIAVELLLDCLEHDDRLTRSISFGRDFQRNRTVVPVKDAARSALQGILQARFSSPAEIRAYWNRYKGMTIEDRWYAILNDDAASDRWAEAAANIVRPANDAPSPDRSPEKIATNAPVRLRGEMLRDKRSPSVSELLSRHALAVPTNDIGSYDLGRSCQMAEYLAAWDLKAALPVARTLSRRVSTTMKYSGQQLGTTLAKLSLARAEAGDFRAFDEYADWIVTTSPLQFRSSPLECLDPFRRFPSDPVLQATAQKLFGDTNSAWAKLPWPSTFGGSLIDARLTPMAGYRVLLCRELGNTNECGTVRVERPGYLSYDLKSVGQTGSFAASLPPESRGTNGAVAVIRWNDWIALALAKDTFIEPFDPFAPIQDRDDAIQMGIMALK